MRTKYAIAGEALTLTPTLALSPTLTLTLNQGSNHCFRIMVMMFSLLAFQLAFPAGYALAKVREHRLTRTRTQTQTLVLTPTLPPTLTR